MKKERKKNIGIRKALKGAITVRVIDYVNGIEVIQNINAVSIMSNGYCLLIMEDYVPTQGRIEGEMSFLTNEEEYAYENVKGSYKYQDNEFTIFIEENTESEG